MYRKYYRWGGANGSANIIHNEIVSSSIRKELLLIANIFPYLNLIEYNTAKVYSKGHINGTFMGKINRKAR